MTAAPDETALLSFEELVRLLHKSERWVRRVRQQDPGFPRPIRLGARLLWRRDEIMAWLEAHRAADAGER